MTFKTHVLANKDEIVTSPFGWRIHPVRRTRSFHCGLDLISKRKGRDYVLAYDDGVVIATRKWIWGFSRYLPKGNYVSIRHKDGKVTNYYHLSRKKVYVKKGDHVKKGQRIGYMGSTGASTGAHLHFEIRIKGRAVDPKPYLQKGGEKAKPTNLVKKGQEELGIKADGLIGKKTRQAVVKSLQEALNKSFRHRLVVDGDFGAKTKRALSRRSVKIGDKNDLVKLLQVCLYLNGYDIGKVDGDFGKKTLRLVKQFQRSRGLVVDGIVGAKTIRELIKL